MFPFVSIQGVQRRRGFSGQFFRVFFVDYGQRTVSFVSPRKSGLTDKPHRTASHRVSHRYLVMFAQTISAQDSSAQVIFTRAPRDCYSLAIILILALISKSRGLSASTTVNYCQRVLHSKGLRGSIRIQRNAREYHNQTKCQEV